MKSSKKCVNLLLSLERTVYAMKRDAMQELIKWKNDARCKTGWKNVVDEGIREELLSELHLFQL